MNITTDLYRTSLTLLTDLYQLTMAYAAWKNGRAEDEAVFHLFFRKSPFKSGYTISAGLGYAIEFLEDFSFTKEDIAYLRTLTGNDGKPLFEEGFLEYLKDLEFTLDLDAMPEGTVVFPHEPILRVKGPVLLCQLVETPLLNLINFQTLIATKSARICQAAHGEPVLEFGLRRAQGIDGAIAAARAAYIGGCAATSNVLAGRLLGIPVKGTHAHSWVMMFDDEPSAFEAYAKAMPNNCVFLVDTYDTIEGVKNAVEAGKKLRAQGHEMVGIRLDSGDLAYLSIEARKILDEGGFPNAAIVASNDLDEYTIDSLKQQDARIGVWGVGTRLVTAHDQPALGGVYKLAAIRTPGGDWQHRVKLSEQTIKTSTPGMLQIRRFSNNGGFEADMIWDELSGPPASDIIVDPMDPERRKRIPADANHSDILVPIFRGGQAVYTQPTLSETKHYAQAQITKLHSGVRRFVNPHGYPAGLERGLYELKTKMIRDIRGLG